MSWVEFSDKQRAAVLESTARINTFDGPVRSGKTTSQRFAWVRHLAETPHPNLLISGQTKDTIRRNVLFDLFDLLDLAKVPYVYNQSEGTVRSRGTTMHIIGANDEKAESRLRGMTIGGWLGDEVNLAPESFVKMALTRMSMAGARAFWTMNPDSPYHYLYTDYITNDALIDAGILKRFVFTLDDNLSLDEEYKASLRALYAPGSLFYKRFILGQWVVAQGAIYDMFDPSVHVISELPIAFEKYGVGVDYGTANATVFLLLGLSGKTWYVIREWRHDSRKSGRQMTDVEYSAAFIKWLTGLGIVPTFIEVDPSAASFKEQLRRDGAPNVHDADNSVIDGIRNVSAALSNRKLYIHESCKGLIEEITNYRWDEKAQLKGEDAPIKREDHGPDALRYAIQRLHSKGTRILRVVR